MAHVFAMIATFATCWLVGSALLKLVGLFLEGLTKHLVAIAIAIPLGWWLGGVLPVLFTAMLEG